MLVDTPRDLKVVADKCGSMESNVPEMSDEYKTVNIRALVYTIANILKMWRFRAHKIPLGRKESPVSTGGTHYLTRQLF